MIEKNKNKTKGILHRILMSVIYILFRFYKKFISPLFGNACRFSPTCSEYAVLAIEKHGFFKGLWLAIKRIIRCNPFCKGGDDPVP